jgi:hypothetical protein
MRDVAAARAHLVLDLAFVLAARIDTRIAEGCVQGRMSITYRHHLCLRQRSTGVRSGQGRSGGWGREARGSLRCRTWRGEGWRSGEEERRDDEQGMEGGRRLDVVAVPEAVCGLDFRGERRVFFLFSFFVVHALIAFIHSFRELDCPCVHLHPHPRDSGDTLTRATKSGLRQPGWVPAARRRMSLHKPIKTSMETRAQTWILTRTPTGTLNMTARERYSLIIRRGMAARRQSTASTTTIKVNPGHLRRDRLLLPSDPKGTRPSDAPSATKSFLQVNISNITGWSLLRLNLARHMRGNQSDINGESARKTKTQRSL